MNQVRYSIPSNIPVTTADAYGELLLHPNVIAASDVVFVNIYPYWDGPAIDNAVCGFAADFDQVANAAIGKQVIISETGWPSGGNPVGAAVPSPANAAQYFLQFATWVRSMNLPFFYFEGFNEEWKANYEGPQGAYWGIWDEYGVLKPWMQPVFDGLTDPINCDNLNISRRGGGAVISTEGSIHCPNTCSYSYPSNTQVTLNATPSQGWTFTGWNGPCSGIGACVVTMNQNTTVGATFQYGLAVYDSTLRTPTCSFFGRSCDSGGLLQGRDNITGGAEPNQPNTIRDSCADGTAGTFHVDESIDRVTVGSTSARVMRQGDIVRMSITVWVADPTQDALDLYYATNANNPAWVYIATLVPRASGAQTLSALFRLRPGPLQAVRANFRKGGISTSCSAGNYDDHDDLVFAVR